jgi:eukaryotic-like serine/threonine-protein kinase
MGPHDPSRAGPGLGQRLWRSGQQPELSAVLDEVRSLGPTDLLAVLQVDQLERWRRGVGVPVETYVRQLALTAEDTILDLIYHEYCVRRQLGQAPRPDEFVSRFPHYEGSLRRLLTLDEALFIGPSLSGSDTPLVSDALQEPHELPTMIGKYRVLARLGSGSQGDVYRAFHPTLHRDVVIKITHGAAAGDAALPERTLAEGRALAQLDCPGLARVHDLDVHEGRPFLVMEYVRGKPLDVYQRETNLSPRQAALLVARMARTLTHAHARGLVHRDLKPSNVLVDDAGTPWIIDFGLALLRDGWSEEPQSEGVCGTVAYMAPEQAASRDDAVSARTDVFALGAVLFFLLTGKAPFQADNLSETLHLARSGRWNLDAVRTRHIPSALSSVCRRAMQTNPNDRTASAERLADELEAAVRPSRRIGWITGVIALAAVALLVLGLRIFHLRNSTIEPFVPPTDRVVLPDTPTLAVHVHGKSGYRSLLDGVPLPRGALVEVRAQVPAGLHATLFHFSSDPSVLKELARWPAEDEDHPIRYPREEKGVFPDAPLEGAAATEVFLLCLRRDGPVSTEEVRSSWPAGPWPVLRDQAVLRLLPNGVSYDLKPRDLGTPVGGPNPQAEVAAKLEAVRRVLQRQMDHFEGVAFPFAP